MAPMTVLCAAATAAMLLACHVTSARSTPRAAAGDRHGGVPMGVPNNECDNGRDHLEVDWNPHSTEEFTCTEPWATSARKGLHYYHCDVNAKAPIHKCMTTSLNYTEDLPTSGWHRPLWPVYGEYSYVPPERWLHSLEHGGIVFLYNPCADENQIEMFKGLAKGCLRRHVIAAYKKLPPDMNFAVLAWKCKLVLSDVDVELIVKYVKARAKKGPEQVAADGQYIAGLKEKAREVTTFTDATICPDFVVVADSMQRLKENSIKRQRHYKASFSPFLTNYKRYGRRKR